MHLISKVDTNENDNCRFFKIAQCGRTGNLLLLKNMLSSTLPTAMNYTFHTVILNSLG